RPSATLSLHDALPIYDHRRRAMGDDRIDELRQPVDGVQQRVEHRLPRQGSWRRNGLDVLQRPQVRARDKARGIQEAGPLAAPDRRRRGGALAPAVILAQRPRLSAERTASRMAMTVSSPALIEASLP